MTEDFIDFTEAEYSGRRLREWVRYQMSSTLTSLEDLTNDLGFERTTMTKMLLDGTAKFSWTHLPVLSKVFLVDPAILICLFLDQEVEESVRETIFEAALWITPKWERPLLDAARRVYIDDPQTIFTFTPDHIAAGYGE